MSDKMSQIADKIQKLLALSGNNPSQEEAQAALLKAQALMAKYSLKESDISTDGNKLTYDIIATSVKSHKFNNALGSVIADSFACRVIINQNGKVAFFGHSNDAAAAASAMEFAFKAMSKGGHKATRDNGIQPGHKGASHFYNSYVLGFISGIKEALDAQTTALAIVVPIDVDDEMERRFDCIKCRASHTKEALSRSAFFAGKSDGKSTIGRRSLA